MEHDSLKTAMVNGHSPEEELLDEAGEQGRWTPVAFTLAVSESEAPAGPAAGDPALRTSEAVKERIPESADRNYDDMNEESRWTPVALRLARSEE